MAYSNAEIYDRNKSEAEREQKLLSKLKQISARGNNAEVKQDRDGNWVVYEVKKTKAIVSWRLLCERDQSVSGLSGRRNGA